jgi:hypothetical protein
MQFAKLIEFSTIEEANRAAKTLEVAGIPCLISTKEKGWLAATDSKVFWISVAPADLEEASYILYVPPIDNVTLLLQCPKCKSLKVTFDASSYLPLWRKILPSWWCKEKFFCADCKNVWERPPDDDEAFETPYQEDDLAHHWTCPWCGNKATETVATTLVTTRRCACAAVGMAWPAVDSDEMIDDVIHYFQVTIRLESKPFDALYLQDIQLSGIEIREMPTTQDPTLPPLWREIRHLWFRRKD